MDLGATVVTHRVIRIQLVLTNKDVNILILFIHELSIFFILIQDVDTCVDKNYRCPTKCVSTGIPNTCNIPNEPASHGRCVTAHQLNNGVNNCADGSDEGILISTFFTY